jgi:3-hydroxyacyl-[acyl-carrier-protein] dehydratase
VIATGADEPLQMRKSSSSPMAEQIRASMSPIVFDAEGVKASFTFAPDFIGFQGHFPGRPILPGVCEIQAALLLAEAHLRRPVRLREIERVRFTVPATCGERLDYHCTIKTNPDGQTVLRTIIRRGEITIARLRLLVAVEGTDG